MSTGALAALVFLNAAAALALEVAAVRLAAPHVGADLYLWSAVIAGVLAGLSLGHWAGGRAGAHDPRARRRWLTGALTLAALGALAAPVAIRAADPDFNLAGAEAGSVLGAAAAAVLLPSLAAGLVAPLAARLAVVLRPERPGRAVGTIYAGGALGSVAGPLAAGFALVPGLGATGTALAIAAAYAALALLSAASWRDAAWAGSALAAAAAIVVPGNAALRSPCDAESRYVCVRVRPLWSAGTDRARVLLLDEGWHSANDRDDPQRFHFAYAALVDRLVRAQVDGVAAPRLLALGGGGFTLPRAWAAARPDAAITVAEIDPAVERAARTWLWFAGAPGLRVVAADARLALARLPADERFDVVLGDTFRDRSVPPHLVTREFHRLVRARLRPGGLYLVNVIDTPAAPALALAVAATLALDFDTVELWEQVRQRGSWDRANFVIAAAAGPAAPRLGDEIGVAVAGTGLALESPAADERVVWRRMPSPALAGRWPRPAPTILTDDYAPVERLIGRGCAWGVLGRLGRLLHDPALCRPE